ncbi:hypothetical protein VNO77_39152 [Canavalia gladiata]|uniref:Major facilitator superfamily (MFS) profile domain-containing protein n=1 Tax=Canavalia gladiata TaxID=3824 RepID=A0AAN9K9Z2_CANGL
MEDSTENLTKSDGCIQQQTMIVSWDEMIEKSLTNFGWKEFLQCMLVSIAMFFDAQQLFIAIYSDNYPTWHCTNHTTICTSSSDICKLPKSSWAWDEHSSKTIISQYGLECASNFITGLPQSSFFIGSLFGSILLATMADSSLGRKNMIILSCLSMSITSVIIIFSTNVWVYSALKLLIGFFRSSIATCVLVLLTERVSKDWRFTVGSVEYFFFALGYMSLPGIAYVNRYSSWKYLYIWISIPSICYSIIAYLFVTESPRWLLMQGREQQVIAMFKGVSLVENDVNLISSLPKVGIKQRASLFQLYSPIVELFKTSWVLKRVVVVMVLGLGIGMVYYAMPLAVGNLGFNIYLAVVFNAFMELPSCVITYFLDNYRRKPSILAFSITSGICSIMCVVIRNGPKGVMVGLAVASFFCACTAYNVFLIYIIELFPTCVRNTTASLVRQAIVFGCIFSPFLISAGRKNLIFSYGVFGIVIICSTFTLFILPETIGIALCDTMDQQEKKEASQCEMGNMVNK